MCGKIQIDGVPVIFQITDTFTSGLTRLTGEEQGTVNPAATMEI